MKRIILIVLLIASLVTTFAACGKEDENTLNNSTAFSFNYTKEEAEEVGKQEIVNQLCIRSGVNQVYIQYGTVELSPYNDGANYYMTAKGTYTYNDAYGLRSDTYRFDVKLRIGSKGSDIFTERFDVSKAY